MTPYIVCKARLSLMAGNNHSQEYHEQNLDLGILMQQAFARCTQYFSATVRRNAFCTIKKIKEFRILTHH